MGVLLVLLCCIAALVLVTLVVVRDMRQRNVGIWVGNYLRGRWRPAPVPQGVTRHLMFCFVDHFEPQFGRPTYEVECSRVAKWRTDYEKLCSGRKDADGFPPVHTFFYPQEEYRPEHLDPIVELCRLRMGEIEVHLHHDKDTEQGLRQKLREFTRVLVDRHDALPCNEQGKPLWAFIHGNWALDNSNPTGYGCGVNNELIVLAEEGCYADFTFPAAPSPCQTSTVNSIYYATDDPLHPKSHDKGERVKVGGKPIGDLMIIQGVLGINWRSRKFGIIPRVENSDLRTTSPPSVDRVNAWASTGVHVQGRPEWIFVKVHTHGAPERDVDVLLGSKMATMFDYLERYYNDGADWKLHYVSAREMYNIVKAAEAGKTDNPGEYRDFVIPRPQYRDRTGATT